jgi:hypothetical protein
MSDTNPKNFGEKIVKMDKGLREKMDEAFEKGDSEQVYRLTQERYNLYTEAEKYPLSETTKVLFSSMKGDVVLQVLLFKIKKDFEEQTSQIVTRLDTLENDVKDIKKKLGIS